MKANLFPLQNHGMSRDLSASKAESTFAWDNCNVRITANDGDTLLSITNERGTKKATYSQGSDIFSQAGYLVGWNTLGEYLILFFHKGVASPPDSIYRVSLSPSSTAPYQIDSKKIYSGNLGFRDNKPIESITYYESEEVQKIYWVDGRNVLRCCNFMQEYEYPGSGIDTQFDSDKGWELPTNDYNYIGVEIQKDNGGTLRPNGTAQYFITAYNKLGVETGILKATGLVYLSPFDRGGATDEQNLNRVVLTISNTYGRNFDYIRVYVIQRTSQNGPIVANVVGEYPVAAESGGKVIAVDTGANYLDTIDASGLLYLGSKSVIASTMCQKDNHLFLGNLKVPNMYYDDLDDWAADLRYDTGQSKTALFTGVRTTPMSSSTGLYSYTQQLNRESNRFKIFKTGEKYRFAVVFRKPNGDRSKAFWIGDDICDAYPRMSSSIIYSVPKATLDTYYAKEEGYVSAQLYMAQATYSDRKVKAQGFLNPTVYNLHDRQHNTPYARPSWTARPYLGNAEYMHLFSLQNSDSVRAELQCNHWENNRPRSYYQKSNGVITNFIPEAWQSTAPIDSTLQGYKGVRIEMWWYYNAAHTSFGGHFIIKGTTDTSVSDNSSWKQIRKRYIGASGKQYSWSTFRDQYIIGTCQTDTILSKYYHPTVSELDTLKSSLPSGKREQTNPRRVYAYNYDVTAALGDFTSATQFCDYSRQHYFVDANIVTFHSPEVEYDAINVDKAKSSIKLRIVGAAQMTASTTDSNIQVSDFDYIGNNYVPLDFSTPNIATSYGTLTAAPMYYDKIVDSSGLTEDLGYYMTYLWHKTGSIINYTDTDGKVHASLVSKRFANMQYSYYSRYVQAYTNAFTFTNNSLADIRQISGYSGGVTEFQTLNGETKLYGVNTTATVIMPQGYKYPVLYSTDPISSYDESLATTSSTTASDPISITYNSRPHILLSLPTAVSSGAVTNITILPHRSGSNGEDIFSLESSNVVNYYSTNSFLVRIRIKDTSSGSLYAALRSTNGLKIVVDGTERISSAGIYTGDIPPLELPGEGENLGSEEPISGYIAFDEDGEIDSATGVINPTASHKLEIDDECTLLLQLTGSNLTGIYFYFNDGNNTVVNLYPSAGSYYLGWSDSLTFTENAISQQQMSTLNTGTDSQWAIPADSPYLWIGELYEDYEDYSSNDVRYGGATDSAVQNNVFIPCGAEVYFGDSDSVTVWGNEGDTYFQRYDCVLAYPQSENDVNQVLDITSVMLETHINLDGRTDKDRGVSKLANIDYTNYGTINPAYLQENNFLSAMSYDEKFSQERYPTTITWSLEKKPLETNDTWMTITLASTLTLDPTSGNLSALRKYRNTILAFQDNSISEVLFNSRVQLSTSDGVPVELANSGKVEGSRLITNKYGCLNKWSIVEGKSGLYFKDDIAKVIAVFNEQGVDPISSKAKLDVLVRERCNTNTWDPHNFYNTVSFYDKSTSDVYFVASVNLTGNHLNGAGFTHNTLVYNEQLGAFVGSFTYNVVPMMTNLEDRFVALPPILYGSDLYFMHEGLYNNFFGFYYPSYVTWRITPEPYGDKLWTNLEYRADFMTVLSLGIGGRESGEVILRKEEIMPPGGATGIYKPDMTIDTMRVWNEYQDTGTKSLSWSGPGYDEAHGTSSQYPDIRKKFRIWRADIPRDSNTGHTNDRIRNPWIYLKLQKDPIDTDNSDLVRMELHDIVVKYFTPED